jgi:glycosyltransferase involved in cell wall biosynthesis
VLCLVPSADVEEEADAAARGVQLLSAPMEPYASDSVRLRRRPQLGALEPEVIIGHGRVTGPQASSLRADFYPNAIRLHVIHTCAGHIEWFKHPGPHETRTQKAAEREDHERCLAQDADVVAAVGSLLTREARSLLGGDVVELVPGIGAFDGELPRALPPTHRCLLAGRAEDKDLKGLDIAAIAFSMLPAAQPRERPQLVVQGAPLDIADGLAAELAELAGSRLKIHVAPYTEQRKQIALELERATVAVMPSRREGFGLSGLEAIGAGIPVLVSANSGLGELLSELDGAAAECVVEVDDDLEVDGKRWAERIATVFADRETAFKHAAEVYEQVIAHCVWSATVATLLEKLELEYATKAVRPAISSGSIPSSIGSGTIDPPIIGLPARNLNFAGQEELLSRLEIAFGPRAGGTAQILTGPSGVGKTQIAVELAWRRRALYDVVWTINAASASSVLADLVVLARHLECVESTATPEEHVEAARLWLVQHERWLLLVDGLDDPHLLEDWLALPPSGDVLITSREPWDYLGKATNVDPWSRDESIAYLLSRTGDPNPEFADILAQALGGLPLAMSMAASVIDESGSSLKDYLENLQTNAPELLSAGAAGLSEAAISATLRAALDELEKEPLAIELLNLASFYAPDRIPRPLLTAFLRLSESERVEGDMQVEDLAITAGMRFAQLLQQDDGFVLHPLLAERTRTRLGEQAGDWALQACQIILAATSTSHQLTPELAPHALAATDYAMKLQPFADVPGEGYATITRLRILVARSLIEVGEPQEAAVALSELEDFLANGRPDRGELDPILRIAVALERSHAANSLGNLQDARSLYAAALTLAQTGDARPAGRSALFGEFLLEVLPADQASEDSDLWYRALAFRALEASHQLLAQSPLDEYVTLIALRLRLCVLRYLIVDEQYDDAVATGKRSLAAVPIHVTGDAQAATSVIRELTATALEELDDVVAARVIRQG